MDRFSIEYNLMLSDLFEELMATGSLKNETILKYKKIVLDMEEYNIKYSVLTIIKNAKKLFLVEYQKNKDSKDNLQIKFNNIIDKLNDLLCSINKEFHKRYFGYIFIREDNNISLQDKITYLDKCIDQVEDIDNVIYEIEYLTTMINICITNPIKYKDRMIETSANIKKLLPIREELVNKIRGGY
ncbi:hypothetical protein [Vallitalea sp.]|uniref:hypothetical protein n=1 Tax=Vallitalea sp. TaxID=1882829 RepID=UPI0025DFB70F|nr:hypothetical protein [Vallitalea sp.]MCT4686095.1 hypothetical protein [Vallitalea sp.]